MIPYIVKTFRGGIADESDKGVAGSFKHGYGLDIHSRDDVLKCGSTVATIDSSTITDLIQQFVASADGSVYAFGSAGSVYSISGNAGDPALNFVYSDEAGNITGAREFQASDGITYMYWATATQYSRRDMSTGEKAVPWTNVTANWKTEKISSAAAWHQMINSQGALVIGNGEGLSHFSFDSVFDPLKLNIRPGNLIKALEERDDYTIIGSERWDNSEEGHIWSWIDTVTNWVQKKRIPVKGVNAIITTERMLIQGGDEGEIFFSDFVNAVPLHAIPGGGRVNPSGVAIDNDLALFGFYGGTYPGLWSYGRRMKNRPDALNYQYRLAPTVSGSSVSSIGAVMVFNGVPLASWGTTDGSTSDYGVDIVSSTTLANATYEGLEFDAGSTHLKKDVEMIKAVTSPLASGTSYSIKYKIDKESAWRYAILAGGDTSYSITDSVESEWGIGRPALIYEKAIDLTASGASTPEIQSLVTYISNETIEHG